MSWQSIFPWIDTGSVLHSVMGAEYTFRPVRLTILNQMREMSKPLAKVLAMVFTPKGHDVGAVERVETKDGIHEQIHEAISPTLAEKRHEQMLSAVLSATDTVLGPELVKLLGVIILDSIRESFKDERLPAPMEFMDTVPAEAIPQFLTGVWKANKGFFGPLQKVLGPLSAQLIAGIQTRVNAMSESAQTEASPE